MATDMDGNVRAFGFSSEKSGYGAGFLFKNESIWPRIFSVLIIVISLLIGLALVIFPGRGGIGFGFGAVALVFLFAFLVSGEDYGSLPYVCFVLAVLYVVSVILWPRYGSLPFNFLPVRNPRRALFILALGFSFCAVLLSSDARKQALGLVNEAPAAFRVLAVYLLWRVFSLFGAVDFSSSLLSLTIELVGVFSAVFIWSICLRDASLFSRLVRILVAVTVIGCLLVVVEGVKARNLYLDFLSIDPGESAYFSFLFDRVRDGVYRSQGAFEHPLLLTEYIVFILPISIALIFNERRVFYKFIWLISVLLLLVASYFVRSRSAFLFVGIVLVIGVFFVMLRILINSRSLAKWFVPLALAIPFAVLVFVLAPYVVDVVSGGTFMERLSTATRLLMIERGLPVILDNPIFGIGPGAAAHALGIYNSQGLPICDNYYLQIAMESGLPALLFFISFWFLVLPKALKFVLFGRPQENLVLAFGVLVGVVGILVFKLIMAETQNFDFLFLGVIGLLVLQRDSLDVDPRASRIGVKNA